MGVLSGRPIFDSGELNSWNDLVVFKVMEIPLRYAGLEISEPVQGGFDLTSGTFEGVVTLSARGTDLAVDQALMMIGGCALAKICRGKLVYPDSGREADPDEEIQNVLKTVEEIASSAEDHLDDLEPFYGWEGSVTELNRTNRLHRTARERLGCMAGITGAGSVRARIGCLRASRTFANFST